MLAGHLLHHVGLHRPSFGFAHPGEWTHWILGHVHRRLCAMRGHDLFLRFEPRRLALRCIDCGWESPGWTIEKRPSSHARHEESVSRR